MHLDLNPNALETVADHYGPDRLKALLVWFGAEQQTPETSSAKLNAVLDEVQQLDIEESYTLLQSLAPEEMVRFSLMNEFGKAISEKPMFAGLVRRITHRLFGKAA